MLSKKHILINIISILALSSLLSAQEPDIIPGELILTYRTANNTPLQRSSRAERPKLGKSLTRGGRARLLKETNRRNRSLLNREDIRRRCRELMEQDPSITGCMPNMRIQASFVPNDPYFAICEDDECTCPLFDEDEEPTQESIDSCQWSYWENKLSSMNLVEAWESTLGSTDTIVAVVDSGVQYTHPDISANMWINPGEIPDNGIDDDNNGYIDDIHGLNVFGIGTNTEGDPIDLNGHGTHVAGTIGAVANNEIGISGVSPEVTIMAVRILDETGGGTVAGAVIGLNYLADMAELYGQNILLANNSWGGAVDETLIVGENGLESAFRRLNDLGILSVNAAGNGGRDRLGDSNDSIPHYPANIDLPHMIAVAATDPVGQLARFSNFGPTTVHLAAPGEDIRSLLLTGSTFGSGRENGTALASGTSMAAPHVSGLLVLMHDFFPALSTQQLRDRLFNRVVPLRSPLGRSRLVTGGMANAYYALNEEEIPVPTPTPTPEPTPTPDPTPTPEPTPEPSPSPTPSPIASPEPDQTIEATPTPTPQPISYLVDITGRKTKRSKRGLRKGKLFPRRRFEISLSSVGLTDQSESLTIRYELNGEECPLLASTVTTENDGTALLSGRLGAVSRRLRSMRVSVYDSEDTQRGTSEAKVIRNRRSKRRGFSLEKDCAKLVFLN